MNKQGGIKLEIKKLGRSLLAVIIAGIVLGGILGAGLVSADIKDFDLLTGTYNYAADHSDNGGGYTWFFNFRNTIQTSSDHTDVTVTYTKLSSGDADPAAYVAMGTTYIWDEQGQHSLNYTNFQTNLVDGINREVYTYWFYGSLNSTNNRYVIAEQHLWKYIGGGWDPLAVEYNDYAAF